MLILLLSPVFAQTFDCFTADLQNIKRNQLSDRGKSQIIKSILLEFDFLNRHIYKDETKEIVYLSTKNIASKYIPKISGINFILLNEREIADKTKNGFGYHVFQKLKIDKIKTSICFEYNYRDDGYRFRNLGSSGSPNSVIGIEYEYRKVDGKWRGTALSGYGSQS